MNGFWKGFIIAGSVTFVIIMGKGIYDACHLSKEDEKMVEESCRSFFEGVSEQLQKEAEEKFRKAAGL